MTSDSQSDSGGVVSSTALLACSNCGGSGVVDSGGCSLESLVIRLGAHIAQMASHQRERRAGQLLIEAHAALSETCEWKQNVTHGYWEGTCGLAWEFTTGTPETNGFWCCPRCGRRVHTANAGDERLPGNNPKL